MGDDEDDSRLSRQGTIVRPPKGEGAKTVVRTGGPRSARAPTPTPVRSRAPTAPHAAAARGEVRLETRIDTDSVLAEGGMAIVYRARDRSLGRPVAMKVLREQVSDIAREGFEREARLMARLDHPGIVAVHAMARPEADARLFTMKLVEGHTIAELIDGSRPPRGRALVALLRSVLRMCETLSYAHDHGVIHRDLKPENVMLGRYGECYIMDWGVAIERGRPKPSDTSTEVVGTPAFMAPEQAHGRNVDIDERTDVYGLGAIIYYILTGEPPAAGETLSEVLAAARAGQVERPELLTPEAPIPARLSDIVLKALQPAREDRFASVSELSEALEQFLFTGEWFTRRSLAAGALIFREGERGDRAYIVESGTCEVYRETETGEQSIAKIGPGRVIGELALFSQQGRTAHVRALTDMTLLEVTRDALERELPDGSWTRQIIDTLVNRFLLMEAPHDGPTDETTP